MTTTGTTATAINDGLSYRDAMGELQKIVNRMRGTENVDVDELVKDVARAKQLIDYCDGKIKRADATIRTIVGELQAAGEPHGVPGESGTALPAGD